MALAFVVTLEKHLPEAQQAYAKAANGKALGREAERLDTAARRAGVGAITSLLSESRAALEAQLREEGFDPAKMRLPAEQWFDPAEGLKTVRGLIADVTANLNNFKQPNPILRDLKAAEALLVAAQGAGVRFHFTKADV
jgi:glycine/D-amino acid oxidase-like deaminating enzyme